MTEILHLQYGEYEANSNAKTVDADDNLVCNSGYRMTGRHLGGEDVDGYGEENDRPDNMGVYVD